MSLLRKSLLIGAAVIIISALFLMTACGGSKTESGSADTTKTAAETTAGQSSEANQSNVKGEIKETEKFSILVPEGWEKMDIPGGVQLYKGTDVVQVSVSGSNVTEAEDKTLLEDMSKQYNGTPLEEVSMFGIKLFKTSFTANSSDQTMYSGVRNGEQVKIQLAGKDHGTNETIKAVVESIKLK